MSAPPSDCMLFGHKYSDTPTRTSMSEEYYDCLRPGCGHTDRRIK